MERYPRQTIPTATNTPTMTSSLIFSILVPAARSTPAPPPVQRAGVRRSTDGDRSPCRIPLRSWAHAADRNKLTDLRIRGALKLRRRGHQCDPTILQHSHPIGDREDFWNLV